VAAISLVLLVLLASTVLFAGYLSTTPRSDTIGRGWQRTPEIRIVMDSTADWAQIMFNDLVGGTSNGARVVSIGSRGWLLGNDTDDRIDAGRLTFVKILYNSTVLTTGDIVGFFKGNSDFEHTRMYVDVVLEVNTNMRQVYFFLILAGAGTTTFQLINKQSGIAIWQETDAGNSFTQYARRWISTQAFFAREQIETVVVIILAIATIAMVIVLNVLPALRKPGRRTLEGSEGL
jgi:hypothetical protein